MTTHMLLILFLMMPILTSIEGPCYANAEMWQHAKDDYRTAISLASAINDDELQNHAQKNLGKVYLSIEQPERAVDLIFGMP